MTQHIVNGNDSLRGWPMTGDVISFPDGHLTVFGADEHKLVSACSGLVHAAGFRCMDQFEQHPWSMLVLLVSSGDPVEGGYTYGRIVGASISEHEVLNWQGGEPLEIIALGFFELSELEKIRVMINGTWASNQPSSQLSLPPNSSTPSSTRLTLVIK